MNEITVDLKLGGIAQIKAELRSIKDQMVTAMDPEQIAALADRAGELQKKLASVNSQINEFKKGSNLDQARASFDGLSMAVTELDFAKAAKESANLNQSIKSLKPEDLTKQFKGFASTIGNVGKSFISLGKVIIANPLFRIVAFISAIIVAVGLVLKQFGVLDDVISALMAPVNALINGFKELTDWLGLTQYAAEENAAKMVEANNKVQESSKEREAIQSQMYSNQIAILKAQGQDTYKMEVQASMSKSLFARERYNSAQAALNAEKALGKSADKEKLKTLKKQIADEKAVIIQGRADRQLLAINDANADAAAAAAAAKAAADKRKENASNRLAAERAIIDNRIALVADETKRELQEIQEKYRRQIEDIKKNEKLTAKEKETLTKQSQDLQIKAEADFQTKLKKVADDADEEKKKKEKEAEDKKKAEAEARFVRFQELTLSESEFKIFQLEQELEKELAAAENNNALKKALNDQFQLDKTEIEKKAAEERIKIAEEEEKKKRDAQLKTANDALSIAEDSVKSIQALGDIAFAAKMKNVKKGSKEEEALAKKQFKFNKAMQLAGAVVDAGKAVTASLAAAPLAIGVVPNPVGIANLAATIATSASNIAKISATQFTSTSAPSSSDAGGGGGAESVSVPSFTPGNLFGQGNDQNNVGSTESSNITVTAVVSETEITSTQNKVAKIQKSAEL
jgi:hypothetical protein